MRPATKGARHEGWQQGRRLSGEPPDAESPPNQPVSGTTKGEFVIGKLCRNESESTAAPTAPETVVTAEQAWKLLSMVNEWIRFADAKAGATLAFSGVMGTLLYNVVRELQRRSTWLDVTIVLTCVLLFVAVLLAGWKIAPRMKDKDVVPDTINNLFFASIAANYKGNRLAYRGELIRLSTDNHALVEELADQVHVNATIATAKNQHAAWAVRAGLVAGLLLALVTIQVGLL